MDNNNPLPPHIASNPETVYAAPLMSRWQKKPGRLPGQSNREDSRHKRRDTIIRNRETIPDESTYSRQFWQNHDFLRHQTISAAFCDQKASICRVWLDFLTQTIDMGFQRVRSDTGVIAPDLMQQHIPCHHTIGGAI